jgi:hypothetical protein
MENLVVIADAEAPGGYRTQIRIQFPSVKYQETMGTETLDTNVLQLADVSLGSWELRRDGFLRCCFL